jgi:ankyrin repeat protein
VNIDPNIVINTTSIEAQSREDIENEQNILELIKSIQDNDIIKVATILKDGETNVNYIYKDEISALGAATFEGNIAIMEMLLNSKAVISMGFSGGRDAGWIAIENHKYEAFDWLVENGLKLNKRLLETYETRLITAVKNSDLRMVSRLLNLKVDPNDSDIKGRTALHYNMAKVPYENDDYRIGELLLAEDCDPNRKDKYGVSAHAYIADDKVYTLLSNYELEKVDKNALIRAQEKDKILQDKNKEKSTIKNEVKEQNKNRKNNKFKAKKYRPK